MKNTFFTRKGGEYVNHFTKKEIFLFKPTCDSLFWYTFVTWNCCVAKKDSITRPSPTSSVARSDIRIKKTRLRLIMAQKGWGKCMVASCDHLPVGKEEHTEKGVFWTLWFWLTWISQIQNYLSRTKQREMPLVRCMQIYASLMTVQRQLYPIVSEYHCVYIHLVGLIRVARFDR